MTRSSFGRAGWLGLVSAAVVWTTFAGRGEEPTLSWGVADSQREAGSVPVLELGNGRRGIADAGGHVVPLREYRRIASGSTVADELLLALAEPERIVALTRYGREHGRRAHLYGARAALNGPADVERLRALQIDLLLVNHYGSPAELARARETGVQVFNLGDMRGLSTLGENIQAVALLLGAPNRGRQLESELRRRMRAVASGIPSARRKRALYSSAYAGQLLGGTVGTSYHDVLTAAGLIDVAAERYRDWPHFDPEELLALDPDIIVTNEGSRQQLCRIHGLDRLRACAAEGGVVALGEAVLSNPGLGMLDAAELLHERVYRR